MDFSVERVKGKKIRMMESGSPSDTQVFFLPGVYNPEIWKHQFRYFSGDFWTFSCGIEEKDFTTQKEVIDEILDRESFRNVVLVSQGLGNSLAQSFEHREEVIATVLTGARWRARLYPRRPYNLSVTAIRREPKLFKKLFFSELSDYRVVRKFVKDVKMPSYSVYRSFAENYTMRKPIKNSMMIHSSNDRFSSLSQARDLEPDASVSVINDAGTFSFYEKPQDYNKALLEFLRNLESFVESREVSHTREKNRSLKDFVKIKN